MYAPRYPNQRLPSFSQLAHVSPELPMNIMTIFFHLYTNQELYQSSEEIRRQVTHLQNIFPTSLFLKTQRALLLYHSKGQADRALAERGFLRSLRRFRRGRGSVFGHTSNGPVPA